MTGKTWTPEEIDYLKENYAHLPKDDLEAYFKRSFDAVRFKANTLGLIREKAKRRIAGENDKREGSTYKETNESIYIVCASPRIKTKDDVIEHFKIDEKKWMLKEFQVGTYEAYRKDRKVEWDVVDGVVQYGKVRDSGKLLLAPLVSTKTKFVLRDWDNFRFEEIDEFFKNYKPAASPRIKASKGVAGGYVLEICFADLHIGDLTIKIAERCAFVISNILRQVAHIKIEKIILVALGDTLHYDGVGRKTEKGTQVESTLDYYEMFDEGEKIFIDAIDALSQIAPVEVIPIAGNHDRSAYYGLFKSINNYYRADPLITVDTTHEESKHRKFGNCLSLWTHADMPKKRLQDLIFSLARKEFGETLFAEIHGGHIHHLETEEKGGVVVRYNPRINDTSAWEKRYGFLGALRRTQSYLWHQETGLESILLSPI